MQFFSRCLNPVLIIDFCTALEIRIVNHVLKNTMIADAILSRSDPVRVRIDWVISYRKPIDRELLPKQSCRPVRSKIFGLVDHNSGSRWQNMSLQQPATSTKAHSIDERYGIIYGLAAIL
jgi:hypothetical protein